MSNATKPVASFREFWLDRWPLDGDFNDVKVLCKKPEAYDGKDAWWNFSGPHVIEYGAFEIADEFRISYKEKIAELTQRNQELVEANEILKTTLGAVEQIVATYGKITKGEFLAVCTHSGFEALSSMDREK